MDYSNLHELRTANAHKETHTTHLNNIASRLQFGSANVSCRGADPSGNQQILTTDYTGRQLVGVEKLFNGLVTLKNNEAIAVGFYQFASGLQRRGQKITVMVKSETGSSSWNLNIEQSIDNSQFIDTSGNLNDASPPNIPASMKLIEFTVIAPYWRLSFENTGSHSAFTIKYIC